MERRKKLTKDPMDIFKAFDLTFKFVSENKDLITKLWVFFFLTLIIPAILDWFMEKFSQNLTFSIAFLIVRILIGIILFLLYLLVEWNFLKAMIKNQNKKKIKLNRLNIFNTEYVLSYYWRIILISLIVLVLIFTPVVLVVLLAMVFDGIFKQFWIILILVIMYLVYFIWLSVRFMFSNYILAEMIVKKQADKGVFKVLGLSFNYTKNHFLKLLLAQILLFVLILILSGGFTLIGSLPGMLLTTNNFILKSLNSLWFFAFSSVASLIGFIIGLTYKFYLYRYVKR